MNQYIISLIIGLVSGALGSLIAPLVNWGIEKKKLRFHNKEKIIAELKNMVNEENFDRVKFINSSFYLMVRDEFSKETLKDIERPTNHLTTIVIGYSAFDFGKKRLLEDINKLEKKWKLI